MEGRVTLFLTRVLGRHVRMGVIAIINEGGAQTPHTSTVLKSDLDLPEMTKCGKEGQNSRERTVRESANFCCL